MRPRCELPLPDANENAALARVLVVVDSSPATAVLVDAVRVRGTRGPARFHLLVQRPGRRNRAEAERILATTLPALGATDGSVSTRRSPLDAIADAVVDGHFDELIVCAAPHRVLHWLQLDVLHRLAQLGLRITTVLGQAPGLRDEWKSPRGGRRRPAGAAAT